MHGSWNNSSKGIILPSILWVQCPFTLHGKCLSCSGLAISTFQKYYRLQKSYKRNIMIPFRLRQLVVVISFTTHVILPKAPVHIMRSKEWNAVKSNGIVLVRYCPYRVIHPYMMMHTRQMYFKNRYKIKKETTKENVNNSHMCSNNILLKYITLAWYTLLYSKTLSILNSK